MLDPTDLEILAIIQDNARSSNAEIARQVGMAPSAVLERVRKLEKRGIIEGYRARLAPSGLGFQLLAFIYVKTDESMAEMSTGESLSRIPEVQEVHHVAGEETEHVGAAEFGDPCCSRHGDHGDVEFIGVDSLAFLTVDGLYRAAGQDDGRNMEQPQYCDACLTGDYPINLVDRDGGFGARQLSLLDDPS